MRNSLLSLGLMGAGLLSTLLGVSDITPTKIETDVVSKTTPLESKPLELYGAADLPIIEGFNVAVRSITPGKTGTLLQIAGVLAMSAGCFVYRRGTGRLVKEFPQHLQRLKFTAETAQEYRQLENQAAVELIAQPRPLTEVEQQQLEHTKTIWELEREQEQLAEQLKVVELRQQLESALNRKSVETTPKDTLLALLKGHENGWIDLLLRGNKPLLILAPAGAGKTTTANAMLMAKKLAYDCDPLLVADIHGHKNMARNWKYLKRVCPNVRLVGFTETEGENWRDYLDTLYSMPAYFNDVIPDEKDDPNLAKTSSFWDEKTFAKNTAIEWEEGEKYTRADVEFLTGSRKGQHFWIAGLHNFTRLSVADGTYDQLRKACNRLELFTNADNTPAFKGLLYSIDDSGQEIQTEVTIPKWLNPKSMVKLMESETEE